MTGNSLRQLQERHLDFTTVRWESCEKGMSITDSWGQHWDPSGSAIAQVQQQHCYHVSNATCHQAHPGSSVRKVKCGYWPKGERVKGAGCLLMAQRGTDRSVAKKKKRSRNLKGANEEGKRCNNFLAVGDNWCTWSPQPEQDKKQNQLSWSHHTSQTQPLFREVGQVRCLRQVQRLWTKHPDITMPAAGPCSMASSSSWPLPNLHLEAAQKHLASCILVLSMSSSPGGYSNSPRKYAVSLWAASCSYVDQYRLN